jgi:hypothetical protein
MSEMIRHRAAALLTVMSLATGCTIARGDVKGLRDAGATHVRMDAAIDTSITALNDLPSHCGPTRDHRVREEEFQVYRIIGTIRHVKRAPDHDIHIVLDDPDRLAAHIIVELPDPDSAGSLQSPYRDRLTLAMQSFENLLAETGARQWNDLQGIRVRVTGVGFFDLRHFQVGRSRSCIELHPVLKIEQFRDPLPLPLESFRKYARSAARSSNVGGRSKWIPSVLASGGAF